MPLSRHHLALLSMLLSMTVYQLSASLAKTLFVVLDPLSVTVLRLTFSAIVLSLVLRSWRIMWPGLRIHWPSLLAYSVTIVLMNMLFYQSLRLLPQGIATGLEFTGPLGLALLSLRQRSDGVWVLLAMLGIVALVPWQLQQANWLGVLLALGAGVFWGLYIYSSQLMIRYNGHLQLHGLTLGIGVAALISLPIGLWQHAGAILDIRYWGYALALALTATVIPYGLDLFSLRHLHRLTYGVVTSFAPVLAALAGWSLLHEQLDIWQWSGIVCIVLASIGVTYRQRPATDASE